MSISSSPPTISVDSRMIRMTPCSPSEPRLLIDSVRSSCSLKDSRSSSVLSSSTGSVSEFSSSSGFGSMTGAGMGDRKTSSFAIFMACFFILLRQDTSRPASVQEESSRRDALFLNIFLASSQSTSIDGNIQNIRVSSTDKITDFTTDSTKTGSRVAATSSLSPLFRSTAFPSTVTNFSLPSFCGTRSSPHPQHLIALFALATIAGESIPPGRTDSQPCGGNLVSTSASC
mmetsp:Transcript_43029/g.131007  ORF Transcript_43029/g.131007 Transcript_43029/m.131007 type:complete len:230 (-) Transcript_43029:3634-4323(-)